MTPSLPSPRKWTWNTLILLPLSELHGMHLKWSTRWVSLEIGNFGSRACYVALKLLTCVCPSVQRFSPIFVERSCWNFVSNWISVCSCVLSSVGVLRVQWAEPTPQKPVFRGETASSYSFDRIGLSLVYVSFHWKTKLFSSHCFDRWSIFGNITSWRMKQKFSDT